MKVSYKAFTFPFKYPFTISKGTKTHQPSLIVQLEHRGVVGYGEAPAITYYNIPVEKMIADLEAKKLFVEKFAFIDPERYWHYLHHLYPQNNFLVCALDIAAWDLYGKIRQQPLYKLWDLDIQQAPCTDYTIGIDTIEKMVEKMQEKPWPIYKIKLGTDQDIASCGGAILEESNHLPIRRLLVAHEGFTEMHSIFEAGQQYLPHSHAADRLLTVD